MKILCWFYLVGKYSKSNSVFENWYYNFKKYFCPLSKRDFLLITDSDKLIEKYKDYPDIIIRKCETCDDPNIIKSLKFKYLKDNIDLLDNYDYIHYSNCNLRCNRIIRYPELLRGKEFGILRHYLFGNLSFLHLNGSLNLNTSIPLLNDISNYIYFQTGNFIGTPNFIKNLINFVEEKREIDFKNNIIQKWHDETYVNYYLNVVIDHSLVTILDGKVFGRPIWKNHITNKKNYIRYKYNGQPKMFLLDKYDFYKI